jgi:hypothetical protein
VNVIDDSTSNDILYPKGFSRGYDPSQVIPQMFAPPSELKLIPRSEWDARIDDQEKYKSSLWHMRQIGADGSPMPTLDQNGQGYCWAYSVTRTVMYDRLKAGLPYRRLSAHAVGCKVKNFRDQGGWCGLSAQFIRENGVPTIDHWKEKSMARSNDTAKTWENAALHKVTEDWVDLTRDVYDQNLTFDQVATCLLLNIPVAVDFNWWGHSVCAIRLVRVEAGSYGIGIDNSWTDSWEDNGYGILRGQKAIPDGAVATRVTTVSLD